MTTLLLVASCSGEEISSDNKQLVTFQVTLEDANSASRSVSYNGANVELGTGAWVDQLIYAVYEKGSTEKVMQVVEDMEDGTALVEIPLVNGVEYDIVFFACHSGENLFDIASPETVDLTNLIIKSQPDANMESYDAFYYTEKGYKAQNNTLKPVRLSRPFAQLNVGTTKMDLDEVASLLSVITESGITLGNVPTVLNARTGQVSGEKPMTYAVHDILECSVCDEGECHPNEKFNMGDDTYYYLAMAYVLADGQSSMHDATFTFCQNGGVTASTLTIPHLPLQRNFRTNVTGTILTRQESFEISLDTDIGGTHTENVDGNENINNN